MKTFHWLSLLCALSLYAMTARADSTSYTGTLASSTDEAVISLTLTSTSDVTLQTYGFGGGTNGAGTIVAPGGTDLFVGLFSGAGGGASFINGGSLFVNFSNGCPPAGTVANFGDTTCGDETFSFSGLAAGDYTILLTDGSYLPAALFDNGTLGEGFFDFTGGQFCNLFDVTTDTTCPNTAGAWALDVTTSGSSTPVPEPASMLLLGSGVAGLFLAGRTRRKG